MTATSDFGEISKRVAEALAASGNPEGISEAKAKSTLAAVLGRYTDIKVAGVDLADGPDRTVVFDVSSQKPRTLRVPEAPTEPFWYEHPEDARMFDHYVLSRRALGSRLQGGLLITGPAGSGKSKGVVKAIERINREHGLSIPLLVMQCPTITDPQKWFGRREIDKRGSRYEESDFVHAVRNGYVILLDEFMRLHPSLHNNVMSFMDGTEAVTLSDLNLTIERHPETVFIGTTNIGSAFAGTHRMDWAMRERWSFTIERDFPPIEAEIKVLVSNNPGCDEDSAAELVDIAGKSRDLYRTGDLRSPISTRTLDNAAFLCASGMRVREALMWTAIPEYDGNADGGVNAESDREKVKQIVDGRSGR